VLSLDISDDGKGIPLEHHIGVGLHTMHERASELGGNCAITRSSSGGTLIQARLPLSLEQEPTLPPSQERAQQDYGSSVLDVTSAGPLEA
jgi:signal transduction histidine kinase